MVLMFVILKPLKLILATKVAETADKNIYYLAPCTESIRMIHRMQSSYIWPLRGTTEHSGLRSRVSDLSDPKFG